MSLKYRPTYCSPFVCFLFDLQDAIQKYGQNVGRTHTYGELLWKIGRGINKLANFYGRILWSIGYGDREIPT